MTKFVAVSNESDTTKPLLLTRAKSWKWWIYGDMNSQPREKAPKGFKFQVGLAFLLWIFIAFHPWISTRLNHGTPDSKDLQTMEGVIVKTSRKDPHIYLRVADGTIKTLEFPVILDNLRSVVYTTEFGSNNELLLNCDAIIKVNAQRFTFRDRLRVWSIKCKNRDVSANFTEQLSIIYFEIMVFLIMPLFLFIYFIRMKRGFYEQ